MEQHGKLRAIEQTLSLTCDRIEALQARLEDMIQRAQRIGAAKKGGRPVTDTMFEDDLSRLRRELRNFAADAANLPVALDRLAREGAFNEADAGVARVIARLCERAHKALDSLRDEALRAQTYIRETDFRVAAWQLVQEADQLADKGKQLPSLSNRVVLVVATPPS